MTRTKTLPVVVVVLGLLAIAAILALARSADQSRHAQLDLANVKVELNKLQTAPFRASPSTGGSPELARGLMRGGEGSIRGTLGSLRADSPPAGLVEASKPIRANFATLEQIYDIGVSGRGYGREADALSAQSARSEAATEKLLGAAAREYDARAARAQTVAAVGTAGVILLLLGAFGFLYRRSLLVGRTAQRLADENHRLFEISRDESLTDELTGLPNRRALFNDLQAGLAAAGDQGDLALGLFDLNGFKQYNDTFGHPAGDSLLDRLGERLQMAVDGRATAYRMGGDEFCVLAPAAADDAAEMAALAALALSDSGEAFEIGCSYGVSVLPREALTPPDALRLADQRMYEHKAGRSSASRQSTDVLLQVVSERNFDLQTHIADVARLAGATADALGLPESEVKRIRLAAELHDVGKTAIPDAVLNKPGKLDEREWAFMRRHTVIGERIVRAAPSLAHTAGLVRASHERYDGSGYPDGLAGDAIPLGASIIAVCDAFDAMVSERPYGKARTVEDAFDELRQCAGTQFDPQVVEVFCGLALAVRSNSLQPA